MLNQNAITVFESKLRESLPSTQRTSQLDHRISMEVLPQVIQGFLTWITGKPATHEKIKPKNSLIYLTKVLLLLGIGVSTSIIAVTLQGKWLLLLLLGWMLTVSAQRQLQVVVVHHCAHKNFTSNRSLDRWIGKIVSALILLRDFDSYEKSHGPGHHRNPLDAEDETVKFLRLLVNLQPGLSTEELWQRLCKSLISPIFHTRFLAARIISSFGSKDISHKIISSVFTLLLLVLVGISNTWNIFFIVWVFPLTILYQISTCLRLCSEHLWPPIELELDRKSNKRDNNSKATVGIFLGDPIPEKKLQYWERLRQWCWWWLRLFFLHLPIRTFILVGDTSCHDYHHRHPGMDDWANGIFARQQDIDAGYPGWSEPYREVIGLFAAIDVVFTSLSLLEPLKNAEAQNAIRRVYIPGEFVED
jgi:fatty acid desaturase